MTDCAMKAIYADYRRVKGRKVMQMVLEIPIEQAPEMHKLFGEPLPDGSLWVAIARLETKSNSAASFSLPDAAEPAGGSSLQSPPAGDIKGGELAKQAGILCEDRFFKLFLRTADNVVAANIVRKICGISSRAELDHSLDAAAKWRKLHGEYLMWLKGHDP